MCEEEVWRGRGLKQRRIAGLGFSTADKSQRVFPRGGDWSLTFASVFVFPCLLQAASRRALNLSIVREDAVSGRL